MHLNSKPNLWQEVHNDTTCASLPTWLAHLHLCHWVNQKCQHDLSHWTWRSSVAHGFQVLQAISQDAVGQDWGRSRRMSQPLWGLASMEFSSSIQIFMLEHENYGNVFINTWTWPADVILLLGAEWPLPGGEAAREVIVLITGSKGLGGYIASIGFMVLKSPSVCISVLLWSLAICSNPKQCLLDSFMLFVVCWRVLVFFLCSSSL